MSIKIAWNEGAGYPAMIKGAAAGIVGGNLVVTGGMSYPWREVEYGFSMKLDSTDDLKGGVWSPIPNLPRGRAFTSGASVAGGLAVVGGRYRNPEGKNIVTGEALFLSDRSAKGWEKLQDCPTPAAISTTFSDGDMLYTAFGGIWRSTGAYEDFGTTGDPNIYCMNVRERSGWTVYATFPGKLRWASGAAICNGKLYILGGHDYLPDSPDMERRQGNVYSKYSRSRIGDNGEIDYVLEVHSDMWEYNPSTGKWRMLSPTPRAFACGLAPAVSGRWLVAAGGANWVNSPRNSFYKITSYVDKYNFTSYSNEVWIYDTTTDQWEVQEERLPYGVCTNAVTVHGDDIYIVGNETIDKNRGNTFNTFFQGHIAHI